MLYHLVPRRVVGSRLLPLNRLKEAHPELYREHVGKYAGREHLLEEKVPGLGCLWTDVLFLTALPPGVVRALHEEAGFEVPPLRWFEVDPAKLEAGRLHVYWYLHEGRDLKADPANWEPFREELLPRLREVPPETREHYAEAARAGRRPFAYFRVPHVLYKGDLEVGSMRVVEG